MIAPIGFRCRLLSLVIVFLVLITASTARADVPRDPPPQGDTLQSVLDRIHLHAKDEAWRQGGLQDEVLEKWLEKLVAAVAQGAERPELKVPVKLADVQPVDPARPVIMPGSLVVGKNFSRVLGARNSIILADGNIELGIPQDSVIIARGVVTVSGSRNCVIVSGMYINGSHDGEPGGGAGGSLLVSRGWINVSSAHGSILVAGHGATAGRSENALFVNNPVPAAVDRFPRHNGSKSVKAPSLPLEPLPTHALAAKIKLLSLIQAPPDPALRPSPSRTSAASGAVFRYAERRYIADLGEPIVDEAGRPVADLEGWKLSYAGEGLAVFERGAAEAVVRLEEKQ